MPSRSEVDPEFGTGVEVGHYPKKRVNHDGIKKHAEYTSQSSRLKLDNGSGKSRLKKKVRDQPAMTRHAWIGVHAKPTQKRHCVLAGVSRTTVCAKRKPVVFIELDEVLKRLLDEEDTRHPFFGRRKMAVYAAISKSPR